MYVNIITLQSFYNSPLGQRVRDAVSVPLGKCPGKTGERVMGLGYAIPYLRAFTGKAKCCFAFMPARQGACPWPSSDATATTLVHEEYLPLPDASVDRIIMIHALEYTENPVKTMNELWRVLVPGGYLVTIVANQRSFWAHSEITPLGCGKSYSQSLLLSLLRRTGFFCTSVEKTLHFLPRKNWHLNSTSSLYEKYVQYFFPFLGGVLIVTAQKKLYRNLPAIGKNPSRVFVPSLKIQQTVQQNTATPSSKIRDCYNPRIHLQDSNIRVL